LTPLVNADTADSRQPSTAYSVDDIKYSPLLPTGWFLTCTVAGTTSAGELVLPTPIAEGDTVTDGTVTWEVHKIGSAANGGDGVPLGAIIAYSANGELPSGYLLCDGSAVSRTMFPDLFSVIGTTYGAGDGSTTFNLPDYNAAERFAQGSTVAGTVKSAGLPNIEGTISMNAQSMARQSGALAQDIGPYTNVGGIGYVESTVGNLKFDASQSNSIYGNSDTVQPNALTCRYIIKAFDGQTPDSALIDITQYAQELATKATRSLDNLSADGENHFLENDFTIIYPNGGSEASPANITVDRRYVEANPYPGYYVNCLPEVLLDGEWTEIRGSVTYGSGVIGGLMAGQLGDSNSIIIKTGQNFDYYHDDTLLPHSETWSTTAPCRVKVWKIGKIPTA
jgi:hypothetical protein